MAGIGFALRRLAQRDDLGGLARAYAHAALIASGPWLFTILSLAGVGLLGGQLVELEELATFRIIIVYNFAFSLVLAGPVSLTVTRYLADKIFLKDVQEAPGMLLGSMALLFAAQAVLGLPFYLLLVELAPAERLLALANFFAIGGIWLVAVFLSALKSYRTVTTSFATGMFLAFVFAVALSPLFGTAGLLAGFTAGLAVILFTLTARVFAEYPYRIVRPFGFTIYFRRYWELPLCGLFYNVAIWIDKWVMWFAPEGTVQAGVMISYPQYDGAMFLAYISIVPAMTIFLVNVETRFFEGYLRFYRDIQRHATLDQIETNHSTLIRISVEALRNVTVLQLVVCYLVILGAPVLLQAGNATYGQIGMFRFGVLGAFFHALLLFASIIISYFDLRRVLVLVYATFMALNGLFSLVSLKMGFPYYGYGYFLASLVSLIVAYLATARALGRLPYLTFVGNNPSLR